MDKQNKNAMAKKKAARKGQTEGQISTGPDYLIPGTEAGLGNPKQE